MNQRTHRKSNLLTTALILLGGLMLRCTPTLSAAAPGKNLEIPDSATTVSPNKSKSPCQQEPESRSVSCI